MQNPKQKSNGKEAVPSVAKLQRLPAEQRAYLFVLIMGILGAMLGGFSTEIGFRNCMQSEECLMFNTVQQKLDGIQAGAIAGMGAAVMLSLPALLKGDE